VYGRFSDINNNIILIPHWDEKVIAVLADLTINYEARNVPDFAFKHTHFDIYQLPVYQVKPDNG
jgi:hypothetical protein